MPDVVCLGIVVADTIARPVRRLPRGAVALMDEVSLHGGGCALNTGTILARFGLTVAIAGKVGRDAFGRFLLRLMRERGLDTTAVIRGRSPTSATVVLVDPLGERTFLHATGANGDLRLADLDRDRLFAARALHVAGALLMPALDGEPTAALLREARRRGLVTSLDTAFDASGRWERIHPCLPHLDLLAASLAEAGGISGERGPERAAAWLRARGAREVAIKLGEGGAYVSGNGFEGHVPPHAVVAIDGTGAGDAFVAGLLYGKLRGWTLERSALLANAAGALATTATGATEGVPGLEPVLALAELSPVPEAERR